MKLTVLVERDPESGWLVGSVTELPGCHTQAPDLATLDANMREAVDADIEEGEPAEPLPEFVGVHQVEIAR